MIGRVGHGEFVTPRETSRTELPGEITGCFTSASIPPTDPGCNVGVMDDACLLLPRERVLDSVIGEKQSSLSPVVTRYPLSLRQNCPPFFAHPSLLSLRLFYLSSPFIWLLVASSSASLTKLGRNFAFCSRFPSLFGKYIS